MCDFKMLPIETLADAGRFLGKLGVALAALPDAKSLEAARRYHQWDGKNTADLKDFVKYVTDEHRRAIVESVIEAFETTILGKREELYEKSLIHADFNDANFLLDDDLCVSGVIDFGDSVERYEASGVPCVDVLVVVSFFVPARVN
jgi:Ser/Thr protein kinase RdoA (MazF antagonist)